MERIKNNNATLDREYNNESIFYIFLKRLIDLFGSVIGLIVLSPIILVVSLLIKFESKGPIIFSQDRIGMEMKL